MRSTRAFPLALLVVVSLIVLTLSTGGGAVGSHPDGTIDTTTAREASATTVSIATADTDAAQEATQPSDEPSTAGTIGYVEGYWYDDELPIDERDGTTVENDTEFEAVVYRSMARVETIRGLPFQEPVSVDVVDREQFLDEEDLVQLPNRDRFLENVRHEATFLVDRDTDVLDVYESIQGDAVAGQYDPVTGEVVVVTEDVENLEIDETILAHELLHALQDQHFDLTSFDRETFDEEAATNGLVEGDATHVEAEYERQCSIEWGCLEPEALPPTPDIAHDGVFLEMAHQYEDGPDYVEHFLNEADGDWTAVDERYQDPPTSATEVIRPGETHEPTVIDLDDRSNDDWHVLESGGGATADTVGEVGMVAMFADGVLDDDPSVLSRDEVLSGTLTQEYEFDHAITEGWAGDELVTYATEADDPNETGFVWQSEWASSDDAEAFVDGYGQLLALHDGEPVDGHQDTVVIDEEYPGAYYLEHDAKTVTIVRAPSVDELPAIRDGAAPAGDDTLDFEMDGAGDGSDDADADGADEDGTGGETADEMLPGFGVTAAAIGIAATVVVGARTARLR